MCANRQGFPVFRNYESTLAMGTLPILIRPSLRQMDLQITPRNCPHPFLTLPASSLANQKIPVLDRSVPFLVLPTIRVKDIGRALITVSLASTILATLCSLYSNVLLWRVGLTCFTWWVCTLTISHFKRPKSIYCLWRCGLNEPLDIPSHFD